MSDIKQTMGHSFVSFWRGKEGDFNVEQHKGGIYFAEDSGVILLDGVVYGYSKEDQDAMEETIKDLVSNSIVEIEKDEKSKLKIALKIKKGGSEEWKTIDLFEVDEKYFEFDAVTGKLTLSEEFKKENEDIKAKLDELDAIFDTTEDANDIIDKWDEVVAFLDGLKEVEVDENGKPVEGGKTLANILKGVNESIKTLDENIFILEAGDNAVLEYLNEEGEWVEIDSTEELMIDLNVPEIPKPEEDKVD